MSIYQTPISEIERDILIKMEADETNEFRIKTELEHLYFVTETDEWNDTVNDINTAHNVMWSLFDEIKNSADHKERLCKFNHFIRTSKSMLQLVTAYEMKFSINPDSTTQYGAQIGSLIWYRGVLGIIGGLRTILMADVQDRAIDSGIAALWFGKILQTKKKWQEKAQGRYPHAR
ncbi:uncharacterized protein LOC116350346 [Contarinia nasturtii]|uniref:uncharacterized protein LOC116350346 n=1 Tax=Contarinia nasturtii TaxID=265458 RepID=UPI0012D47D09|nr:uncharacterized protein LOC116350346 [Contarinia nasturtii]